MNRLLPSGLCKYKERYHFLPVLVIWFWTFFILNSLGMANAAILAQENFENETMAPWKIFVTSNGTIGGAGFPHVVSFDVGREGKESKSLQFKVGHVRYATEYKPEQGGGLIIHLATETGKLSLLAHVAVRYDSSKDKRNLAGGLFQWVVDEHIVASHDCGPIENGETHQHYFTTDHLVNAGDHTIRLQISRPFLSHPTQDAPYQYVEDVGVRISPNP